MITVVKINFIIPTSSFNFNVSDDHKYIKIPNDNFNDNVEEYYEI